MKITSFLFIALTLVLAACAPVSSDDAVSNPDPSGSAMPANETFAPMPEDAGFLRSEVYLDAAQLLTLESFPLQFMLNLKGNLPTPCHQLRIAVNPPDSENKVMVEVYSISNPDEICIQVLAPFEVNYPLGSFPAGIYSLWINGVKIADFQS